MVAKKKQKYFTSIELSRKWGVSDGLLRTWRLKNKGPKWITLDIFGNEHGPNSDGSCRKVRYRVDDVYRFEREQAKGPTR